jgi:hypothetical protein
MRTIPISKIDSSVVFASECDDGTGAVPKINLPLTRRGFLKGSGILMGTIAAGSALSVLAPSPVWAVELKVLSKEQGQTLMAMGRILYPHKQLPDAVYALLAKDLDARSAGNPELAYGIVQGVTALNNSTNGDFIKASESMQLSIVKSLEGTPFFEMVRGQCITSIYDNDMAFVAFGYPGACWEKGGYITRGFQDLKWLPAPSLEASPPVFKG